VSLILLLSTLIVHSRVNEKEKKLHSKTRNYSPKWYSFRLRMSFLLQEDFLKIMDLSSSLFMLWSSFLHFSSHSLRNLQSKNNNLIKIYLSRLSWTWNVFGDDDGYVVDSFTGVYIISGYHSREETHGSKRREIKETAKKERKSRRQISLLLFQIHPLVAHSPRSYR
jgi:hypothetical protein